MFLLERGCISPFWEWHVGSIANSNCALEHLPIDSHGLAWVFFFVLNLYKALHRRNCRQWDLDEIHIDNHLLDKIGNSKMLFRQGKHFDLMSASPQHVFKAAEIRKAPAKLQHHYEAQSTVHSGTEFICHCDTLEITTRLLFVHFNF